MVDFRKYTDQTEYSGDPGAKLYKHGQIRFNKHAGQRWWQGVDKVSIHVTENEPLIGFKPATDSEKGTYALGKDGEYSRNVSIRSVLSHYGIWHERMDESIPLPVEYDGERDMVIVDIGEAVDRWGHMAGPPSGKQENPVSR